MINSILKAAFAIFFLVMSIALGVFIAQFFAIISVGAPSIIFAIIGGSVALCFAYDFMKTEVYGEW